MVGQTNGLASFTSPVAVPPEAVREQIDRILADPQFRTSQRSGRLLRFIIERTLKGQTDELKERIIGMEVFGRAADYDTTDDSTVRVAVKELRKRLSEYYSTPEHSRELRINIPLGSYVADCRESELNCPQDTLFEQVSIAEVPALPQSEIARTSVQELAKSKSATNLVVSRGMQISALAAFLVLVLGLWATKGLWAPRSNLEMFWHPVTGDRRGALIVVGAPSDMDTRGARSELVSPSESAQKTRMSTVANDQAFVIGSTSMALSRRLTSFLRQRGKESEVRTVPSTELSYLMSEKPSILYGRYSNEWAGILNPNLRIRMYSDINRQLKWIADSQIPSRQWSVDGAIPVERVQRDYALITRFHDPVTGTWWIGICSLVGKGVVAANQILLDPSELDKLASNFSKGWEKKNVQIVLETDLSQGSPGATRVVTAYVW